jgi:predicted DNA-binding protein
VKAIKCSDYRPFNLTVHTAKKVATILRRIIEIKVRDMLGEDKFRFRTGKGNRDATEMLGKCQNEV